VPAALYSGVNAAVWWWGLQKNNADSNCISLSAFRNILRNGERASMKKGEREARRNPLRLP
jgi:hypothetical protein